MARKTKTKRKPAAHLLSKEQCSQEHFELSNKIFYEFQDFINPKDGEAPSEKEIGSKIRTNNHLIRLMNKREQTLDTCIKAREQREKQQKEKSEQKEPGSKSEPGLLAKHPHWKSNVARFAREALGVELFEHQRKLCESDTRVTLLIAGRGAGKSLAARVKAIHQAVCYAKHRVLVVSSGQRMSSNFGEELLEILKQSNIVDFVKDMNKQEVIFKNGSRLNFLPANAETIRGYHPKFNQSDSGLTVVLDEACFMENGDEIRKAVEYTLITTPHESGKLFIVSSPSTIGSWVYYYAEQANVPDSDVTMIQCGSTANPLITKEELERLKAGKNELEYRAEVLGEWVDGAFGLFSGLIEPNIISTDGEPLSHPTQYVLGVDLALSFDNTHDRNAIALLAKYWPDGPDEIRYRLQELFILEQASDMEVQTLVKQLFDKYLFPRAAIEQYQGKALAEFCQRMRVETELVAPTMGNQQLVFHEMHRLLRMGILELPDSLDERFFAELRSFEYRREPNGKVTFGHPPSGKLHDDSVYALGWAIYAAMDAPPPIPVYDINPFTGKVLNV